jgi:hypothetical protein
LFADELNGGLTMPTSEMHFEVDFTPEAVRECSKCGDLYSGNDHECETTVATPVLVGNVMAPLSTPGHLGTRDEIQNELDGIAAAMRQFHIKHPDQVMRECSAYGARLTELAVLLHRVESADRQYTRIRTQQVDRFLKEIESQFKIASRLVEIHRQDLEIMR